MIRAPVLDRLFDVVLTHVLIGRSFGKFDKLVVRGEPQGNDLGYSEARVKKFFRQHEMAQIFFGPDSAVLGAKGK